MTSNPHAEWRLGLAREIASELRNFPGIRAIFVAGSAARGYADEYSDLEIPLFWEALPGDDPRRAIAAHLGADFLYPYNGPAREDNLLIHGFQVDLWHITVQRAEETIDHVLNDFSLDLGDSNFMDTLRFCVPLYGEPLIEAWKARAAVYPDPLTARQIEQALRELHAAHLLIQVERGNPTLLYGQISDIQQKLFLILLALNRRYFPTFKWIYPVLDELEIKPGGIETRFRRAYTAGQKEAVEDTMRLVEETLQLVQKQFPQIDLLSVQNQIKVTRKAHRFSVLLKNRPA